MAANRITPGGVAGRAALVALSAAAALALLAACGSGGKEITVEVPDPEGDARILNTVLARQQAVVDAYERSLPALRGRSLALARELRGHEQEHVVAVLEAMRRVGARAEPEAEAVASPRLRGEADHLAFLAELEGRSIEIEQGAVAALTAPGARRTLAAIAANRAQHLVLLRQALGAGGLRSVPAAFEDGAEPLPGGRLDDDR